MTERQQSVTRISEEELAEWEKASRRVADSVKSVPTPEMTVRVLRLIAEFRALRQIEEAARPLYGVMRHALRTADDSDVDAALGRFVREMSALDPQEEQP